MKRYASEALHQWSVMPVKRYASEALHQWSFTPMKRYASEALGKYNSQNVQRRIVECQQGITPHHKLSNVHDIKY